MVLIQRTSPSVVIRDLYSSFPVIILRLLRSLCSFFLQCCQSTLLQHFLVSQILVALNNLRGSTLHFLQFSMSCFRYKFYAWMQYSTCGVTSDLYNLSIASLFMVTFPSYHTHSWISPFWCFSTFCLDGIALLCLITLKSISYTLTFNTLPTISYAGS